MILILPGYYIQDRDVHTQYRYCCIQGHILSVKGRCVEIENSKLQHLLVVAFKRHPGQL